MAGRIARASALGNTLAAQVNDPEGFTGTLTRDLHELADPAYGAEQERVAPGSGPTIGVRAPLVAAAIRPVRRTLQRSSSATALSLAQRLAASPYRDVRLLSLPCLRRALDDDRERAWQLMRRLAGGAEDWISIDSMADLWAHGILLEGYRWAELEQLVYSPRRGERRLVGSTLARIPHQLPRAERSLRLDPTAPLALVESLMGDDQEISPEVAQLGAQNVEPGGSPRGGGLPRRAGADRFRQLRRESRVGDPRFAPVHRTRARPGAASAPQRDPASSGVRVDQSGLGRGCRIRRTGIGRRGGHAPPG